MGKIEVSFIDGRTKIYHGSYADVKGNLLKILDDDEESIALINFNEVIEVKEHEDTI